MACKRCGLVKEWGGLPVTDLCNWCDVSIKNDMDGQWLRFLDRLPKELSHKVDTKESRKIILDKSTYKSYNLSYQEYGEVKNV